MFIELILLKSFRDGIALHLMAMFQHCLSNLLYNVISFQQNDNIYILLLELEEGNAGLASYLWSTMDIC